MKKFGFTAIVLGSCLAMSAHASLALQKILHHAKPKHVTTTNKSVEGVDFSGTWQGECQDGEFEAHLTIDHYDDRIFFEDNEMRIGALNQASVSAHDSGDYQNFALWWNKRKTALKGTIISSNLPLLEDMNQTLVTDIMSFDMRMVNEELVMKIQDIASVANNRLKLHNNVNICKFKRVSK